VQQVNDKPYHRMNINEVTPFYKNNNGNTGTKTPVITNYYL